MLAALAVPAIVMTARWDVIGWNRLGDQVISRLRPVWPPERRNLLRILLVDDETYQGDPVAYEAMAPPDHLEVSSRLQSGLRAIRHSRS